MNPRAPLRPNPHLHRGLLSRGRHPHARAAERRRDPRPRQRRSHGGTQECPHGLQRLMVQALPHVRSRPHRPRDRPHHEEAFRHRPLRRRREARRQAPHQHARRGKAARFLGGARRRLSLPHRARPLRPGPRQLYRPVEGKPGADTNIGYPSCTTRSTGSWRCCAALPQPCRRRRHTLSTAGSTPAASNAQPFRFFSASTKSSITALRIRSGGNNPCDSRKSWNVFWSNFAPRAASVSFLSCSNCV